MKDKNGFEYFLTYLPGQRIAVWATPQRWMYFYNLYKLVFLFDPVYTDFRADGVSSYYGTCKQALGEEFINVKEWNPVIERRMYFRLSELGMIRGVASLYPEAEVNN